MDGVFNDVKVAKANSIKMPVERNLALTRFKKHMQTIHTLVTAHVKRKVMIVEAMAKIRELLERGRLVNRLEYFVKIAKSTQEMQQLSPPVESNDLELWMLPGLV